jgi:uncharacterized protein involved in exopolysaccharide biosynthesis
MKENQPQTLPVYPVQYIPNTQDEISLVDIWLTLRKHRKLFLMTAIGISLLGLILALLTPKGYDLNTSLQISTALSENSNAPIESPETAKAKLESSLIPMVINKLNSEKEETEKYDVSVSIPKDSSLIVLTSKTSKKDEGMYRDLHNKIVDAISQEHSRFTNVLKKNLQAKLILANISLDEMQHPTTLVALIKPHEKLLAGAQAELNALSDPEIFDAKLKLAEGEVQNQTIQPASLEDQAVILDQQLKQNKLKEAVTEIELNIAQLLSVQKLNIITQRKLVGEIQAKLAGLMETRALAKPTLSAEPTSTPRQIILLIAMFLGGILGIAAVFFAELRKKVAETVSEQ